MNKTVKVFSPATIGNIGPGFDVLGLAVKGMGDIIEVWKTSGEKILIEEILNADHNIIATRLHIAWNGNLRNVIMYTIKIEKIAIDNNKKNASINLSYITII